MKLETCSACQDLPTLQFCSKSDYRSWSYCPILILFVLYFKNSMYFSKQSYKQRNTSKVICTFIALGDTIIDTIFTINFFTIHSIFFSILSFMEDDNRIAYFWFFHASYFVLATFLTQKHTMLKQLTIKCDTTDKIVPLSKLFP